LHLRHEYDDIVEGNLHIHIRGDNCAEVFVTEGNAERVSNFIGRMRAIRGIEQVKYSVVPLQQQQSISDLPKISIISMR
jgi:CopG family nickel-responsive transcriptional regulator